MFNGTALAVIGNSCKGRRPALAGRGAAIGVTQNEDIAGASLKVSWTLCGLGLRNSIRSQLVLEEYG